MLLKYDLPKIIVATNIAQEGITIPGISVIDTGKAKISVTEAGVEALEEVEISKADCKQREGRAGRTEGGRYTLCSDFPYENRADYTLPEIQRSILDRIVLHLAVAGLDAEKLEFFHQPNIDDIKNAKDLKGKKVGIPSDYFGEGISEDVAKSVLSAAETLKSLGAEVEEFSMPVVEYAIPTYYIIACAEACSNLSRFDGIKYGYKSPEADNLRDVYFKSRSEGFGMEVKKRIMLGNFVLSSGYFDAYYIKALKAKGLIVKAFNEAFEKYDFLLGPVAPTTALKMGEGLSDPLAMYLGDIYTVMINIAGLPSLALPCGFDKNNMPVGMQLIGRPFDEKTILSAGNAYQSATDWHTKKPNLV